MRATLALLTMALATTGFLLLRTRPERDGLRNTLVPEPPSKVSTRQAWSTILQDAPPATAQPISAAAAPDVPPTIVYEAFFFELRAYERTGVRAYERADAKQGAKPSAPAHHQRVLGLSDRDYRFFRDRAERAVAALEENRERRSAAASLLEDRTGTATRGQLRDPRAERVFILQHAIDDVHSYLGDTKFMEVDRKITAYISRGLRRVPLAEGNINLKKGDQHVSHAKK